MTRRIIGSLGLLTMVAIVVIAAWFTVLAVPSHFFSYERQFGSITVHSNLEFDASLDSTMYSVIRWLEPIDIYDPERKLDVYLCEDRERFSFFAKLTMVNPEVMGYNLSQVSNSFINLEAIRDLGIVSGHQPRYASREGNVAHVITHELVHQYSVNRIGYFGNRKLPVWKTEGYCEYGSNFVRARSEAVSLVDRLRVYQDDAVWSLTARSHRDHYLWGIMIEYLASRRGLTFEQIMDDSIIKETVYSQMVQGLSEDEAI